MAKQHPGKQTVQLDGNAPKESEGPLDGQNDQDQGNTGAGLQGGKSKPKIISLTGIDWEPIKKAVEGGEAFKDIAERFNVKENTIRAKARRLHWTIMPSVIDKAIKEGVTRTLAKQAESWAERGNRHRERVFDIATNSLAKVKKVPVRSAKDVQMLDQVARRAAGLETADTINNTLIQLNESIAHHDPAEDEVRPFIEGEIVEDSLGNGNPEALHQGDQAAGLQCNRCGAAVPEGTEVPAGLDALYCSACVAADPAIVG